MKQTDLITPTDAGTIPALFTERVKRSPNSTAYRYFDRKENTWKSLSWTEVEDQVTLWRSCLGAEQLAPGDRVAVMLPNSPEWVCFDLAAQSLGLIVVPLYINDRPDNVAYILRTTEARLFFFPGGSFLEHLAPIFDGLDHLKTVLILDENESASDSALIIALSTWLDESKKSNGVTDHHEPQPEDTATVVFTSGTTGPPKGVMLSHHNLISNAYSGNLCIDIFPDDTFLSFLPLSHMLERTVGFYLPIMSGSTVAFARSIPDLPEDLQTIKPSVFVSVPRIFERVYGNINNSLKEKSAFARRLFKFAVDTGWKKFEYEQRRGLWDPSALLYPVLDKLVGKKVRDRLGGNLRVIVSGGAPLSPDIARMFLSLGLPLYQGYGLTETSPVISVNRVEDNNPSGVGRPLAGFEVKVSQRGELLVRGECVMQGYWKNEEATRATFDDEGWLLTGDKAALVDGHIRITGRIKEIIVLSNGEKVSPSDIETAIAADPLFEQSMVIGEGQPHLILLAVLNEGLWEQLAKESGISTGNEEIMTGQVQQLLTERCDKLMKQFPGYAHIHRVIPCPEPWTVENGLLTPTMKVKRTNVMQRLQREIDEAYGE